MDVHQEGSGERHRRNCLQVTKLSFYLHSKHVIILPRKIQIFRSLQELQGQEPDDDEVGGDEEIGEDDLGSVWEEVVEEEKFDLLEDKNEKKVEGMEFIEEVDAPFVEEDGNENEEEQFVDSIESIGGSVEEEIRNENEDFVEEVGDVDKEEGKIELEEIGIDNEKVVEDSVEGVGGQIDDLIEEGGNNDVEEELADENSNSVKDPAVEEVSKEMLVEKVTIGRAKSGSRTRRAVWVGRKRGLRSKGAAGFWKVIGVETLKEQK